ncbi:glycosyltransferase [Kitasatospora phosalacinea]|uniref:glycosyltransferase n=1 Tax=Kitasatospora phosalacinea TaxID=2065 RepID=UPI000ADB02DB|nr:nucleotide disphospho-sugar-binding domain-containing protein [Kitasatospora phosalacinea]
MTARPPLREVADLLRTVLGRPPAWLDTLRPDTLLDGELHLESHDLAAWSLALRTRYGPAADLAAHLTTLDLDALTAFTLADAAALAGGPAPAPGAPTGADPPSIPADGKADTTGAAPPAPSPSGAGGPRGRFLFVSLPLFGHVNPLAAVSRELLARGHEVLWAGSESFLRPLLGPDTAIAPIPLRAHRGQADRGTAAARSRWDGYIVPHAGHTLPGIERAVAAFRPDVLAVDQHAVAGALAAHRAGLPWASLAPTTMELTRPYRTAAPRVEEWIERRMADMWTAAGLPGAPPHDLRFSPHLLVAFTGEALTGPLPWPRNAVLVGPALAAREPDRTFPWEWIDPARRQVLVTVGTLSLDLAADFHARTVEALRPLGDRLQAVIAAPDGTVADPPGHVLVRPRVPVLELMPRLDAVVSHGGLNTVCEALAHGVPLLVAPIKGDQPINAAQVAAAGAGRRVRFAHASPQQLRAELLAVLDDPSHAAAARRVQESFAAAGGAPAAADHLETLLPAGPRPAGP